MKRTRATPTEELEGSIMLRADQPPDTGLHDNRKAGIEVDIVPLKGHRKGKRSEDGRQ